MTDRTGGSEALREYKRLRYALEQAAKWLYRDGTCASTHEEITAGRGALDAFVLAALDARPQDWNYQRVRGALERAVASRFNGGDGARDLQNAINALGFSPRTCTGN